VNPEPEYTDIFNCLFIFDALVIFIVFLTNLKLIFCPNLAKANFNFSLVELYDPFVRTFSGDGNRLC